jgi:hypothetical protein
MTRLLVVLIVALAFGFTATATVTVTGAAAARPPAASAVTAEGPGQDNPECLDVNCGKPVEGAVTA